MADTPIVTKMNIQQQGALNFPVAAGWVDNLLISGAHKEYSIATLLANGKIAGNNVFLIFSCDGPFWANFHGTARIPTNDAVDGSGSEFMPMQR